MFYNNIICIPGNADIFLTLPPGNADYTNYFFEIEKVLSTTLNNDIALTPISNFSLNAKEDLENVVFDIEISTDTFFDNPKIFIQINLGEESQKSGIMKENLVKYGQVAEQIITGLT